MTFGAWYGRALGLAGAVGALVPALVMWGFTVDDALIPLRYAHHLVTGVGYRFNAHGLATDGVTPLPWAPLIAPLATGDDLIVALQRVKAIGVLAWTFAGGALGHALAKRAGGDRRVTFHAVAALVVVALAFPIGAWAASGMETGIATALATLAAVSLRRPRRSAVLAGLVACFRPELVVWAMVLAGGAALTRRPAASESAAAKPRSGDVVAALATALAPFAICALVRLFVFGRVAPLALLAKPSDLPHGAVYAGAASVVVLTPLLAFAPLALRRASVETMTIALAAATHVIVVIAVGGDWMPYARLLVPIAPSLALVHVDIARRARDGARGRTLRLAASAARTLGALAIGVATAVTGAPAGRQVQRDREALIARARPLLASSRVVAALDIGWVGAATEAEIVDLAGLTDPAIASLSGGHTSKAVDIAMLLERDVDTIVLYSSPRIVELRISRSELFARRFERVAQIALGDRGASYAIYRRRAI
jgi:hypothetical protein